MAPLRRQAIRLGLLVGFLAGLLGLAGPAQAADVQFPPGSRLGLVPPPGFVPSLTIRGFEDDSKNAAILIFELPPAAFAEIQKSNGEPLKTQGISVEKRETLALDGDKNDKAPGEKAMLLTGRQQDGDLKVRKWILVAPFPDATAVVSVQAADKAVDAAFDQTIRTALATLKTRPQVPIAELVAMLPFRVGDPAGFRPVRVAAPTTEVLTSGDKDSFESNEQPILIISAAVGAPDSADARQTFAGNLFSGFAGLKDIRITGSDMIRMNGQQTHQIMADAKNEKSGDDVKLVQWVKFGGNAFIRIVGIARADAWTEAFPRMRTARDSTGPSG